MLFLFYSFVNMLESGAGITKWGSTSSSGIMSEIKDSKCPVQSFVSYLQTLNPNNDRIWQRPRESFLETDETW